jgi:DNA-binding IclR family transcriptional regulator
VVTSLGKAMLASMSDDELDARLALVTEMPQLTTRSHRTMDDLRTDLATIRETGYAVDDQQNTAGITCFGVALTRVRQPTAVSTTLISSRVTPELRERLTADLRKLAKQLSGNAA